MISDHHPYRIAWVQKLGTPIISVSCTPNGSVLVAGAVDKTVSAFTADGHAKWTHGVDHEVWATSISADGSRVAVGTAQKKPAKGSLHIFDGAGNQLWRYELLAPIWSVCLSSNGEKCLVGSWDGSVYAFAEQDGTWALVRKETLGDAGIYGVSMSDDGNLCIATLYDYGLYVFQWPLILKKKVPIPHAGYHTAVNQDASLCVLGLRDGAAAVVNLQNYNIELTSRFTQRPICGTAISGNGAILALGSFDGNVYLARSHHGRRLWTLATDGEIWDLSLTKDGRFVVIGSGDGRLLFVENSIAYAALLELQAVEHRVGQKKLWHDRKLACDEFIQVCLRYRLIEYGKDRIVEFREVGILDETLMTESLDTLFSKSIEAGIAIHTGHFYLAERFESRSEWWKAGLQYLDASESRSLKVQALFRAGFCFAKAGHTAAAQSCFRRSREFEINNIQKRVLYDLARSYEDARAYPQARDLYDVLLTSDRSYRDVEFRLSELDKGTTAQMRAGLGEVDYTSKTVSMLGPNAPTDVDEALYKIRELRNKELYITASEREAFTNSLEEYSKQVGSRSNGVSAQLAYDFAAYIKYDHAPPEDELKKRLELVNVRALLKEKKIAVRSSLDIGAATGRYPGLLAREGIEAIGMDREPTAVDYAKNSAVLNAAGYPKFVEGDAQDIPFPESSFDLVTCMMGTFSHMTGEEQKAACAEVYRVLRPGGAFIVSTWDVECSHLSFMSMYTQEEKKHIFSLSPSQPHACLIFTNQGFEVIATRAFALIPDVFSYELGLQELGVRELDALVKIDLAVRSTYPQSHGQMYLIAGRKPTQ